MGTVLFREGAEKDRAQHHNCAVAAVMFLILFLVAGIRAAPGVLMVDLERELGWTSATISGAISLSLLLYGFWGPSAAFFVARTGVRGVISIALGLIATGMAMTTVISSPWHLFVLWGVLVGSGAGLVSLNLGAMIVNSVFEARRGVAMGVLSAASGMGQLVLLPILAATSTAYGWRSTTLLVAVATLGVQPLVWRVMKNVPIQPPSYRGTHSSGRTRTREGMCTAIGSFDFWVLAGTFLACGATTSGLIASHFVAACVDHSLSKQAGAGLLALMGVFDLAGTTLSGWLSDRYNNRVLLATYYVFRGISLFALPSLLTQSAWLSLFAAGYGLNWIATVPPTVRLTADKFGRERVGVLFGWMVVAHQLGAALASLIAGSIRTGHGSYDLSFWLGGALCLVAAASIFLTGRSTQAKEVQA